MIAGFLVGALFVHLPALPVADAPYALVYAADDEQSAGSSLYKQGTDALDRSDWDGAVAVFSKLAAQKGDRADGALYWWAYALNKQGRRTDALRTIGALRTGYPTSRWVKDAGMLELEIKQASGQPAPAPRGDDDEDLKLMALGGLMQADPDRALPLLKKMLSSSQSDKVRDRAMFVLAQSGSAQARTALVDLARTSTDEDTQVHAIRYLGLFGGTESRQALADIYASGAGVAARKAVLNAFMLGGDKTRLAELARKETSPELRREAIHQLGITGAQNELWAMYPQETAEGKRAIIEALFVGGGADKLGDLALKEADPELRREAIQKLGLTGSPTSAATLKTIYSGTKDAEIKKAVLNAYFLQGNAALLVQLAKTEQDPAMKREAVRWLSLMNSKDATDYMLELLK
jgi:HEAT repeat protein